MTDARSRAIVNVLRIRRRNGSPLTPRERDEVLWWRQHGDMCVTMKEYHELNRQDTQPMVDGEFGELLEMLLLEVLPPEEAEFTIRRTVWK